MSAHKKITVTLTLCLLLAACGSGGASPAANATSPALNPQPAQTQSLTLIHGLGFICWLQGQSPERIWCWASEQAALDNGDAGRIGLTDLNPQLIYTAPGATTFQGYDHGICYWQNCLGNTSSTSAVYTETVSCDVTSSNSVHCPEANADLTFPGITLSRLFPDKAHSPTYRNVRKTV